MKYFLLTLILLTYSKNILLSDLQSEYDDLSDSCITIVENSRFLFSDPTYNALKIIAQDVDDIIQKDQQIVNSLVVIEKIESIENIKTMFIDLVEQVRLIEVVRKKINNNFLIV